MNGLELPVQGTEAHGIRPAFDHLLVRQPKHADKDRNGLIIPGVGFSQNEAEVLAVGPGRFHDGIFRPVSFKVGDRVLLAQAAYQPIAIDVASIYRRCEHEGGPGLLCSECGLAGEKMNERIDLLLVKEGLVIATVRSDLELLNAHPKKAYATEWEASSE